MWVALPTNSTFWRRNGEPLVVRLRSPSPLWPSPSPENWRISRRTFSPPGEPTRRPLPGLYPRGEVSPLTPSRTVLVLVASLLASPLRRLAPCAAPPLEAFVSATWLIGAASQSAARPPSGAVARAPPAAGDWEREREWGGRGSPQFAFETKGIPVGNSVGLRIEACAAAGVSLVPASAVSSGPSCGVASGGGTGMSSCVVASGGGRGAARAAHLGLDDVASPAPGGQPVGGVRRAYESVRCCSRRGDEPSCKGEAASSLEYPRGLGAPFPSWESRRVRVTCGWARGELPEGDGMPTPGPGCRTEAEAGDARTAAAAEPGAVASVGTSRAAGGCGGVGCGCGGCGGTSGCGGGGCCGGTSGCGSGGCCGGTSGCGGGGGDGTACAEEPLPPTDTAARVGPMSAMSAPLLNV